MLPHETDGSLLLRFIRGHDIKDQEKESFVWIAELDGYEMTDGEYTRAQMLLGPHYRTLIKVWVARQSSVEA